MFSEVQRNYIQHLVTTNNKEYPYYLAYTNTNVSNQYLQDDYNFYVILSKSKITANSKYSYTVSSIDDCIVFCVKSSAGSYNYHTERVVNTTLSNTTININNYEFVYTNAQFNTISLQPDLISNTYVTETTFNGVMIAMFIVIISVIFFKFLGGR